MSSSEDARERHFERAKRAVLGFLAEQGGVCGLAELHDYSESRWFLGHQHFSRMMEECVAGGLLTYDDENAVFTLTEAGRAFVAGED